MSRGTPRTIPLALAADMDAARGAPGGPACRGKNPFAAQAKMLWHLDRLAAWRLTGDTSPVLMEVNLTNACNEACRWCLSANSHVSNPALNADEKDRRRKQWDASPVISGHPERRRGLDVVRLRSFLREAAAAGGLRAVTWSGGGEPTSHPQFLDAVRGAAAAGLEQGLMTNGLYRAGYVPVLGETLKWVRVSLDTLDPARYEYQKRTKGFPQVIANIRRLVKYPAKTNVNMNLAAWNADEVLTVARWCRDEGVDYFQIRPVLGLPFEMADNAEYQTQPQLDWPRIEPLLLEAESYSTETFRVVVSWDKFEDVRDVRGDFGRVYKKCLSHFFVCVLNADGELCVCMYHLGDPAFSFGNIYENTFAEIWGGPRRRQVVEMCASRLDLSTCQVCCKGHEINKLMHFLETPDPGADVNFL
jgi:MoaA/NifB/PqqE/SkfB family radical SAM enzyme